MAMIDAWVAMSAKGKLVRQQVELGPLGAEEVEVQVERCGLCHSGLIPKCGHAAVRLECFFVDGCVDSSSSSSSAFNSARHSNGSQRQSVRRSRAIASRV